MSAIQSSNMHSGTTVQVPQYLEVVVNAVTQYVGAAVSAVPQGSASMVKLR